MTVAALYDIHANLPALTAVLSNIDVVGPDVIVIGGDVAWGPWPHQTMDVLRELDRDVRWIMGNADRDVFDRETGTWRETNDWCADRLSEEHLAFLRDLPSTVSIDGVLYCHGSPRADTDPMTLTTPAEVVETWCAGHDEETIVCGHTHGQFDRTVGSRRIVNAGSIGNPFGAPGAYWALLGDDVELMFTPYDTETTAAEIRATGFPYGGVMASQICSTSSAEEAARFFG